MTDPLSAAVQVATALDAARIPYSVGGSLASSFSGEPRASIDADIVVAMTAVQIRPFLEALSDEFYADPAALERAVATVTTANVIHRSTGVKVDLFVAGSRLDRLQIERRRLVRVATDPDRFLYLHTPEDILLQKLHWYRLGGGASDRQWRDVVSIIVVQGARLDRHYLHRTAGESGVSDLLDLAFQQAGVTETPGSDAG